MDGRALLAWTPPYAAGLVGGVVDGFRIDSVVGRGAAGTVYRATQIELDRPVALKILNAEVAADPGMVARFHREARAVARLAHPGVVAVFAVGECPDRRPYMAMELIDGTTLEHLLEHGPLPAARAVGIARQIAAGLAETHAHGIVHRDLKPANVMLVHQRAGGDAVKLVDFGVARSFDDEPRLTAGGCVLGTPHYMAPEQASGEPVDARTDVYALGCVLYVMLAGTVPFDGSAVQVMMAHLSRAPEAPSRRVAGVPRVVDEIVLRCLAKRPDDRFASADELASALDDAGLELAATRILPRRALPPPRPDVEPDSDESIGMSWAARQRRGARTVAAVALVALAAMGAAWGGGRADGGVAMTAALARAVEAPLPEPTAVDPVAAAARRSVLVASSGLALRVTMPAALTARTASELILELWDSAGEPLAAPEVAVTLTGPDGRVRGLGAPAREPGQYRFRIAFPRPGAHVLRVFVLDGDATLTIPFEVESGRPDA